jgi:hypothetical protein
MANLKFHSDNGANTMNAFVIKFRTNNAAFDEDGYCDEVARILREIADYVEHGSDITRPPHIVDINGNTVGYFSGVGEERKI